MSNLIARFASDIATNPPNVEIASSLDFDVVILTAQTLGDEDEPGVIAPVVFNRRQFAAFMGSALANADRLLRADIETNAALLTSSR